MNTLGFWFEILIATAASTLAWYYGYLALTGQYGYWEAGVTVTVTALYLIRDYLKRKNNDSN
jgi:hypothetical protein